MLSCNNIYQGFFLLKRCKKLRFEFKSSNFVYYRFISIKLYSFYFKQVNKSLGMFCFWVFFFQIVPKTCRCKNKHILLTFIFLKNEFMFLANRKITENHRILNEILTSFNTFNTSFLFQCFPCFEKCVNVDNLRLIQVLQVQQ